MENHAINQERRYKQLLADAREGPERELAAQEKERDRITAALKEDKEQLEREVQAANNRVQQAKGDRQDYDQAEKDGGFDVVKSTSRLNDE